MSEERIKKLLGLLDNENALLSELHALGYTIWSKEILAELAFRLRDETQFSFSEGVERVHKHLFPGISKKAREENALGWLCQFGKPTYFIVAALIAKEMK